MTANSGVQFNHSIISTILFAVQWAETVVIKL